MKLNIMNNKGKKDDQSFMFKSISGEGPDLDGLHILKKQKINIKKSIVKILSAIKLIILGS